MEKDTDLEIERKPERKPKLEKSRRRSSTKRIPFWLTAWRIVKPFVILALAIFIVYIGTKTGIKYAYNHYFSPIDVNDTTEIAVEVAKGSSLSTISKQLKEEGLIKNSMVFKLYVDFLDMSSKLQSGKHTFTKAMSYDDIIAELKRGNNKRTTVFVTFREGSTIEEIAKVLENNGFFGGDTTHFLELAKTGKGFESYQFIKDAMAKASEASEKRKYMLEGYLFCDKYEFYTDSTEEVIINRLLARFNEIFVSDYVTKAEEMNLTIDDVVTLASIIEKEAKRGDFAKVSAVFHNRLKKDMSFGSDATLQYYLGTNKLSLTETELATETLYNTHLNKGLPLGPVSQPSKAAIDAVLYPDEEYIDGKYLYFCLAEPESGQLVFAKTYEEHQENVDKYKELWNEFDKKNNG